MINEKYPLPAPMSGKQLAEELEARYSTVENFMSVIERDLADLENDPELDLDVDEEANRQE